MNGNAAVDSNAYIAVRNNDGRAAAVLGSFRRIYLPVTVLGELLFGAACSGKAIQNRELVQDFADSCMLLPVNEEVALRYAELKWKLRKSGKPIPDNDLWIAALCIESGLPLITRDEHFTHLPDLRTIRW